MAAHTRQTGAAMVKLEALLSDILKIVRKHGEGVPPSLAYHAGELRLYKRREATGHPLRKDISDKFQQAAPT